MPNKYPIVNVTIGKARTPATIPQAKALIIGQSNDVNITSGLLYAEIGSDELEIKNKFGATQHITKSILAFREINKVNRLDVIPLNDNGGATASTGSIAFTGTASENGTLYISIGSSYFNKLAVPISKDDTATTIGDTLEALITADTISSVTAVNTTGTVALTSINKGTISNYIGLRVEGEVAGVSVALTAMSGGATDPVLTNLFNVIQDERYDSIAIPLYVLSDLITELNNRFNPTNKVLDGVGFVTNVDIFSNLSTALDTLDSRNITYQCRLKVDDADYKGSDILEYPEVISSRLAALRILRRTNGANITKYMVNGLSRGDISLNSIPYFNSPIQELSIIPEGKGFSETEINTLASKNGSILTNNSNKTSIILNRMRVVSQTVEPILNFEDTYRAIRDVLFYRLKDRYAQSRMVGEGQERAGQPDVSKSIFIADMLGDWQYLVDNSLIRTTTADGRDTKELFLETAEQTIELNFVEGRITVEFLAAIVTQLVEANITIIPDFQ
jgi:hypothetical protein